MSTSQIPGPPPPQQPPQYPPPQQQPGWGPYGGPPPPKRHRPRKWLLILTGVVAAFTGLVVALAVGNSTDKAANPSTPAATASSSPSSQDATYTDPNGVTCMVTDLVAGLCPTADTSPPVPAGPDMLAMGDT
ncbi:MAG TPA: hypothetical protein VHS32_20360, partial [Streptosporangiaceae bacterium]|nr:hypothetical protein [Streptosporangiaceae bacterium]